MSDYNVVRIVMPNDAEKPAIDQARAEHDAQELAEQEEARRQAKAERRARKIQEAAERDEAAEPRVRRFESLLDALNELPPSKRYPVIEALQDGLTGETPEGLQVSARSLKELRRLTSPTDPQVLEWIRGFAPGEVFYDIGANVGKLTLAAAALHRDRIRIVAIEPSFASFESLVRNLSRNRLLGGIIPLQVALLDHTGLQPMHYTSTAAGTSGHGVGQAVGQLGETFVPAEIQLIPAYRLDDLSDALALPPPTRLKMDVDGHEEKVLRGAARVLARGTIAEIEIEVIDHDRAGTRVRAVTALLLSHRYDLVETWQHPAPEGQHSFVADYLFRRHAPSDRSE